MVVKKDKIQTGENTAMEHSKKKNVSENTKIKSTKESVISDVADIKKNKSKKSVVTKQSSVSDVDEIKNNIKTDKKKSKRKDPAEKRGKEENNDNIKASNNDYNSINSKQLDLSDEKNRFHPSLCSKMYRNVIIPQLQKELNIKNVMAVPRIVKVCVNQGVGSISGDKKLFETMCNDLSNICGQKAINCKSKKAISNFKLKEGANVGCMVTLRGKKMYEFLDRLINIALPRIRDFRGLRVDSFDNYGVYNIGLKEQIVFPEVNVDKNITIIGMNISIITTSRNKDWNLSLLKAFGFPFKKK